ncbi:MAG: TerB family tellurite resistance protein [Pseudomonadota bacterium]
MFGRLLDSLTGAAPAPLPEPDARLALTALMVRVARADQDYQAAEATRIEALLAAHYALDSAAAAALREEGEALERAAPDTVRFTRALKDAVPYEERDWVVEALWTVALADDARDHREDAVLRLVTGLLGITDRDSGLARQRAAEALGG